ncbi:related to ribosomal protein L19, mitochondrial [Cephalotrichum gorgonifer]|uniref:Related to ribosomal protein L19, mitochondrial n=1 Tax=Cephalotrichum gorgonifer TaxID=2041049 RepID=A0AAE8N146_9PEZI|nr:related to ribosomal protein L19, mitochondrial [Cephalotrichum gorgonifer]
MNVLPFRQPLGCLKTVFRQTRYQRQLLRTFATETTPTPPPAAAQPPQQPPYTPSPFTLHKPNTHKRTPFAVYTAPTRTTPKDPMVPFHSNSISSYDPTGARTSLFSKARPDRAKVGDVLLVATRTGEPFAGAFMQIRRRGVDTAIQLRGQLMKTGVEMWFKIYSPSVVGIDIIWRRPKRARRARLTYLRKKGHDMGNVDHLVWAWKRERSQLRSSRGKNLGTVFES